MAGSRPGHGADPDQQQASQQDVAQGAAQPAAVQASAEAQQPAAAGAASWRPPLPAATSGLMQQAGVLAAASALALSLCLSTPAAATAGSSLLLQQQSPITYLVQQQQQWQPLLPSAVQQQQQQSSTDWPQRPQQHQQQEQASPVAFASSSSSASSSSWLARQSPDSAAAAGPAADPYAASLYQQYTSSQQHQQQQEQQQQQQQPFFQPQQQQQQQLVFEVSSRSEDSLLEALRQIEAQVDRTIGAVSSSVQLIDAAQASSEQAAMDASAQSLIREVWEVVDLNYMDARQSGFDHAKWAALRDAALQRSYRDTASMHRAVRDMMAQGVADPYCHFIEPREFAAMKKYDVTGVGLNLGTSEEFLKKTGLRLPRDASAESGDVWVVGLSRGSEAERAGVAQGDQLLQIAGTPLAGISPFQAATLIAGPDDASGTGSVELTVLKADGSRLDVEVARPARVLPSPVKAQLNEQFDGRKVGVIHLSSFNARALRDVSAALGQLQQQGATELVLDLRDNRGGLVSEGLEVARLFLGDSVPIVLTQSKSMASQPPLAGPAPATGLPLTVLVNEHTASASEILAGALKDNCRGVLVGSRTYGKGLIQSVYELTDNSGLVITVGKYLTPRGVDIDRHGIAPDFSRQPAQAQAQAALQACRLDAAAAVAASAPGAAVAS